MLKVKWHNVFLLILIIVLVAAVIARFSIKSQLDKPAEGKNVTLPQEYYTIGAILPLSGDNSVIGQPVKDALMLAVEDAENIPINVIFEDSKCLAAEAAKAAKKLAEQDNAIAIVGEICSSATLAAAPIAEENKVILISPASTNPDISKAGEYVFRAVPSDIIQGVDAAKFALALNATTAAILYINNDYGSELAGIFEKEFDGKVLNMQYFEPETKDFSKQLGQISKTAPDAIFVIAMPLEGSEILKQIRGIKSRIIVSESMYDVSVIDLADEAAENVFVLVPKQNDDNAFIEFARKYTAKYGKEPGLYSAEAYDSMNMLIKALKSTDKTSEQMKEYISSIKDYPGASGKITFDENGDVIKPFEIMQVKDGRFIYYSSG